jgi:hypothetical protein
MSPYVTSDNTHSKIYSIFNRDLQHAAELIRALSTQGIWRSALINVFEKKIIYSIYGEMETK